MSLDLLSLVYQYRTLLGRRDVLHQTLSPERLEHLEALERLFEWQAAAGTPADPARDRRRMVRCEAGIAAQIETHGIIEPSRVIDIGGDGMALDPAPAAQPGDHVTIMISDLRTGIEYRFPAEVAWRDDETSMAGVRFDGLPVELRHRRWVDVNDNDDAVDAEDAAA